MEAESCVACDLVEYVGGCDAHSAPEFTVVVTGTGTDAEVFEGNTTADTGGGLIETVATLPGGTALNNLTCTVGDDSIVDT